MPNKNILFITTFNPYLQVNGAYQRTHHLFNALKQYGNVDILFFNTNNERIKTEDSNMFTYDIKLKCTLQTRINSYIHFYTPAIIMATDSQCHRIYKKTIQQKKYDLIVCRYIYTAIMCGIKDYSNVVIDVDDIPWHNHFQLSQNHTYSWIRRLFFLFKYKAIKKQSLKIMSKCKLYYTANPQDCLTSNAQYLPNIPSIFSNQDYIPQANKNILFIGFMAYSPNYQGIDYFIQNIWNKVYPYHTDSSFYIAGKGTPQNLKTKWEKNPNVHVLGYVDNLEDLYKKCFIVVVPIYNGAGTNIKVLEALAMKKICVVSQFATKGFEQYFSHGKDILVAKSDNEYIQYLIEVLNTPEKFISIATQGYYSILNHYTKDNIKTIIKKTLFQ